MTILTQKEWIKQQIISTKHITALIGFAGIILSSGYFETDMAVYCGYAIFFLITAASMLKIMIICSIIIGAVVSIFPFLAPIAIILMILFFCMRIQYLFIHWRPVLVGLLVYGFGIILLHHHRMYMFIDFLPDYIWRHFLHAGIVPQSYIFIDALIFVAILHFLLVWLYSNGYSSDRALGIMGSVPLVLLALLLPFLKVFAHDGGGIDFAGDGHGTDIINGNQTAAAHADVVHNAQGDVYVRSYLRTVPDGIAENNLGAVHDGASGHISEHLQLVKGHWRGAPDGNPGTNHHYQGDIPKAGAADVIPKHGTVPYTVACEKNKQNDGKKQKNNTCKSKS